MNMFERRRFRQRLKDLNISHAHAMTFLRALAYNDGTQWKMRALAEHAVASATTDAELANASTWYEALRHGGRVRISSFPILALSTDPDISVHRVAEIEEALSNVNLNE